MLKRLVLFVVALQSLVIYAVKDSTRWDYHLKGLDIRIGTAEVRSSPQQALNLLKAVIPEQRVSFYNYDDVMVDETRHYPCRVLLSAVMTNDHNKYRYFFSKREFKFGVGYESGGLNYRHFRDIKYTMDPKSSNQMLLSYVYRAQYIEMGYQVASRPLAKVFAIYGGINGNFGLNAYKDIQVTDYSQVIGDDKKVSVVNTTYYSAYCNAGIKYNMSCDLNFFLQYEQGWCMNGKPVGGNAKLTGIAIGMRYKIIDEQDRPKYELMKYW